MVGKFGASGAFAAVILYSSELFPTDYRSVGIGACSTAARAGGVLAPLVNSLVNTYDKFADSQAHMKMTIHVAHRCL